MESRRYCGLVLPLQEIALRRATFNFCAETILETSFRSFTILNRTFWTVMAERVKKKLSEMVLHEMLKEQMAFLVKPILGDIKDWTLYHEGEFVDRKGDFGLHTVRLLRLTWSGAIDYQKTAAELADCDLFDAWNRFKIACRYCLEDKIRLLWEELPDERKTFQAEERCVLEDVDMVSYWCFVLREDSPNLQPISSLTFYRKAFRISAISGNKAATQFFFQKLAIVEEDILLETVGDVLKALSGIEVSRISNIVNGVASAVFLSYTKYSDVLLYLLSKMNPEQELKAFKKEPCTFITTFLVWPCHDLFLQIADFGWRNCLAHELFYLMLLGEIHASVDRLGYYFPGLFRQLFPHSPHGFRKAFADHESYCGHYFEVFFEAQDTKTIRVVLGSLEASDRMKIISSEKAFKLFNVTLLRDRWSLVQACLEEAALSEKDRKRLRVSFRKYVTKIEAGKDFKWRTHDRRKVFYDFLREMDKNSEKRSAEDETTPQVEKLCIEASTSKDS